MKTHLIVLLFLLSIFCIYTAELEGFEPLTLSTQPEQSKKEETVVSTPPAQQTKEVDDALEDNEVQALEEETEGLIDHSLDDEEEESSTEEENGEEIQSNPQNLIRFLPGQTLDYDERDYEEYDEGEFDEDYDESILPIDDFDEEE